MIDIHPPHHAAATKRDFVIHLATIVLGILIALGLEQTIEILHQHQQRHDLREGAIADARIYLHDVDQNRAANTRAIEDLTSRIEQVREAISQHRPPPPPAYRPAISISTIRLGNLSAAKSSGQINLLSQDEIASAGDAEVGVVKAEAFKQSAAEAATKRLAFEQRFQSGFPSGPFDFSRITSAQLDDYLDLLLEERVRRSETLSYLDEMHRGSEAYLNGQRNLQELRKAQESTSH